MNRPRQASEREAVDAAIRAVRGGDTEAFAHVVETYQRRMFGLLLMMTHDRAAAEDVMQEAFIRAYRNLHRYDPRRDFYPWLATIAVRLAQNRMKRDRRIEMQEGGLAPEAAAGTASNLLSTLIEDERAQRLWRKVASLPRGERTAVFLHYREDMRVADVATTLGVTEGTVKTMLFRARDKLRQMMTASELGKTQEAER